MTKPKITQEDVESLVGNLKILRSKRIKAFVFASGAFLDLLPLDPDGSSDRIRCSYREAWVCGFPVVLDPGGKIECWAIQCQPKRSGKLIG